jgi:hypothetical protein
MPLTARPAHGLAALRTLATQADARMPAHKAYLRISFLELECARHGQEMATAERRLACMRARCRTIEAEKSALLATIGQAAAAAAGPARAPALPPGRRRHRFQVSY